MQNTNRKEVVRWSANENLSPSYGLEKFFYVIMSTDCLLSSPLFLPPKTVVFTGYVWTSSKINQVEKYKENFDVSSERPVATNFPTKETSKFSLYFSGSCIPINRPFPFYVKFWSRQAWTKIDNQMIKLINFPFVIQNDWKTANFARLYYPHFTTFRNETSESVLLILWCSFKLRWNFCPDLLRSKFHLKGESSIRRFHCHYLHWHRSFKI
jgi:hypothetical protein